MDDPKRALDFLTEASFQEREVFNDDAARTLDGLAQTYLSLHDPGRAEDYARRSLELRRKIFGEDHEQVADALHTLALIQLEQERWPEMISTLDQVETMYRATSYSKYSLARVAEGYLLAWNARNEYGRVIPSAEKALRLMREAGRTGTREYSTSLLSAGTAYMGVNDLLNARKAFQEAYEIEVKYDGFASKHAELRLELIRTIDRYETARGSTGEMVGHSSAVRLPKVGRNDPCPCGSRRKFKKCCGA